MTVGARCLKMRKLTKIVSALALAYGLASPLFGQKDSISFAPQFNYVEAGMNSDGSTRARSYTTNNLIINKINIQHGGFHEVYDFNSFFSRNGFFIGKKDATFSGGVIQSFTNEEFLPTRIGARVNKLPFGFYGFFDAEIEANDFKKGSALRPGFTMFAGKDVKGFGGKPLSLWYFTFGDVTDMG